jgi:hypothetical protein
MRRVTRARLSDCMNEAERAWTKCKKCGDTGLDAIYVAQLSLQG